MGDTNQQLFFQSISLFLSTVREQGRGRRARGKEGRWVEGGKGGREEGGEEGTRGREDRVKSEQLRGLMSRGKAQVWSRPVSLLLGDDEGMCEEKDTAVLHRGLLDALLNGKDILQDQLPNLAPTQALHQTQVDGVVCLC